MIDYLDKRLQHAAERLSLGNDFELIAAALQQDYRETAFATAPEDVGTRETCYQRHSMVEEFRTVIQELVRQKLMDRPNNATAYQRSAEYQRSGDSHHG